MIEQEEGFGLGENTPTVELSAGYLRWLEELNRHLPAGPATIEARAESFLHLIEAAVKNRRPDILRAAICEMEDLPLPDQRLLITAYLKASALEKTYYFQLAAPLNQALNLREPWACEALLQALEFYPRQFWGRATQLLGELPTSVDDESQAQEKKPLTVKAFFNSLGKVLAKNRDFDRLLEAGEFFLSRFANPVGATQMIMNVWLTNHLAGFPQYQEFLERAWKIIPWADLTSEQVKYFFETNAGYIAKAAPADEIWLRFWRNFSSAVVPAVLEEENESKAKKANPNGHGLKFRETEKECFWHFLTETMQGGRKALLKQEIERRSVSNPKTFTGKWVSDFIVDYGDFLLKDVKADEKGEEEFLNVITMLLVTLRERGGQNLDLSANPRFHYVLGACGRLFGSAFLFRLSVPFQNNGYEQEGQVINSKQSACKGLKSWRQRVESGEEKISTPREEHPLHLQKRALDALLYATSISQFLLAFYPLPASKINAHWQKIDVVFENLLAEFVANLEDRDWEPAEFDAYFQKEFSALEQMVFAFKNDSAKKNQAADFLLMMRAAFAENDQPLRLTGLLAIKMGFVDEGEMMIPEMGKSGGNREEKNGEEDHKLWLAVMTARAQAWLVKTDLL